MVLAELGRSIKDAIGRMSKKTVIDQEVIDQMLKQICSALLSADVNVKLVWTLRDNIKKKLNLDQMAAGVNKRKLIQNTVVDELVALLSSGKSQFLPKKGRTNIFMMVGLQGGGKTTTCTKMAYHYQKRGWKTCLVCADTFRAGAFDQLKQNATKANIPYYGSYSEMDPVRVAQEGVEQFKNQNFEIIIVDTSGRHKQEASLFEEMQQVSQRIQPDEIIFVLDSTIGQAAFTQAAEFKKTVNVGSVVVTKLDGHAKGGGALSAVAATKCPIIFIGDGEHIHNFVPFDTKRFVARLLGMGDLHGLVDMIKETNITEQTQNVMKNIAEGHGITLRFMYEQFQYLLKFGTLSSIMEKIPGFGSNFMTKEGDEASTARIKRFMTIMDSMTAKELDSDGKMINKSRCNRICRGSGTQLVDIHQLLTAFAPIQKALSKGNFAKLMGKAGHNPEKAMNMNTVQKLFPPNVLKQMGGAGNLQNMMRMMGKMDGMEGMMGGMPGMPGMGGGRGGRRGSGRKKT